MTLFMYLLIGIAGMLFGIREAKQPTPANLDKRSPWVQKVYYHIITMFIAYSALLAILALLTMTGIWEWGVLAR